jgi:alpha-L-rhamnosidase
MDAGIICPHTIWKVYGDTRVIERHWDSMTRFMDFRQATSPSFNGVSIGNAWGDWLNLKDPTPLELIDSAYFAHTAQLMAEMAEATGRGLEAAQYRQTFESVRKAFADKYITSDGTLLKASQTACVLALQFDLAPRENRASIGNQLARLVEANQNRMTTGFLGTKSILPALTSIGKQSLAMRLFQSREFPSWGYPVVNGATSVWERWDSYTKENSFGGDNNAAMNSFSHYSFGAVCQWMFQSLAGIDTDGPGYQKILLKPIKPFSGSEGAPEPLTWVKASYASPTGNIKVEWRLNKTQYEYSVEIPPNTSATLHLPTRALDTVSVNDTPMEVAKGVKFLQYEDGVSVCEIQPGAYRFQTHFGQ